MSYEQVLKQLGETLPDNHEELKSSIQALEGDVSVSTFSAPRATAAATAEKPSDAALGIDDVSTIIYVNFNPATQNLTPEQRAQLQATQTDIDLNTNFLSWKAGVETQSKINAGQLKGDMDIENQIKRGAYRAKVVDYILNQSTWMGINNQQFLTKDFKVKKSEFHAKLLQDILGGLGMPVNVYNKLETLLNDISNSITQTSSSNTKRMFWILLSVYTWESVLQQFRPSIRTIYFEVSNSMYEYTDNKTEIQEVNLHMGWSQTDAIFNVASFAAVKASIYAFLAQYGNELINGPIEIPVD